MEAQEAFDALIEEYGAAAVIDAFKNHKIHPDGGGCTANSCPVGYVCVNGQCILDGGGG